MTYTEVENLISEKQIPVDHPYAGAEYALGDAAFTVLCPQADGVSENDLNSSSVGIKLVHGENSFVMCGDAEAEAEQEMCIRDRAPFVTMFMYLDEVPEGQTRDDLALIIEEVLIQRMQGVKNEKGVWITPAFPKLIYVLDEDNITEDSKYW